MRNFKKITAAMLAMTLCLPAMPVSAADSVSTYMTSGNFVYDNLVYDFHPFEDTEPVSPAVFHDAGIPVTTWSPSVRYHFSVDEANTLTITGTMDDLFSEEPIKLNSYEKTAMYFGGFATNSDSKVTLNGQDMEQSHSLYSFPESVDDKYCCTLGANWWRTSFTIDVTPEERFIPAGETMFTITVENWDKTPFLLNGTLYGTDESGQLGDADKALPIVYSYDGHYLSEDEYQKMFAEGAVSSDPVILTERELTHWSNSSVIVTDQTWLSSLANNEYFAMGSDAYEEGNVAYQFHFHNDSSFDIMAVANADLTIENGVFTELGGLAVSSVDYDTNDIYVSSYNQADVYDTDYNGDSGYLTIIECNGQDSINGGSVHEIRIGVDENENPVIPRGTILYRTHVGQFTTPLDCPYSHSGEDAFKNRGEYFIHVGGVTYQVYYNSAAGRIYSVKVPDGKYELVDQMNALTASDVLSGQKETEKILGDANGDGDVDIMDVIAVNKALLGSSTIEKDVLTVVDFDGNGLDTTDSLNLLKYIVDLVDRTYLEGLK